MIPLSPEAEWLAVLQGVPQWVPPMRPTVVIAPHPDDETLGAGGLIATQRRRGVPVIVVAVTNGEAAYPGACGLGEVRRAEQQLAVAELGVDCTEVFSMHLPDGNVVAFEEALTDLVRLFIQPSTLLVAPWSRDPHPDHEACGRVAERMANTFDISLISYVFWAWHRNRVEALSGLPSFDWNWAIEFRRPARPLFPATTRN